MKLVCTLLLSLSFFGGGHDAAMPQSDPILSHAPPLGDRIKHPLSQRDYYSDGRKFLLRVLADPGANARTFSGQLSNSQAHPPLFYWHQRLPQELGPRFALVSKHGTVVLIDQWINAAGANAIQVIDVKGKQVALFDFEAVAQTLNIPRHRFTEKAKFGAWISAPPVLDDAVDEVHIQTGGETLSVRLPDGSLHVRKAKKREE